MSLITIIYLADIVCGVKTITAICSVVLSVMIIIYLCEIHLENRVEVRNSLKKVVYKYITILISMATIFVFSPSKEAIYMMAGAKSVQTVYDSPEAKEIGTKIMSIVNKKLDEQLKEK